MDHEPLLSADRLSVQFATASGVVHAVDDVSLSVRSGETFSIIGESGSGKTTLGRALVGSAKIKAGALRHTGIDPFSLSRHAFRRHRRSYQIVLQDPNAAFNPRRTILQSVREPLDVVGEIPRHLRNELAIQTLSDVQFSPDLAGRYPHQLSGGQKQRANIARALILRPTLLVCDEVVAALDLSVRSEILNLLMSIQARFELTIVFITHDLSVARHISDRIAVMYLGKIVESAAADELVTAPRHPYTKALLSAELVPLPSHMRPLAQRTKLDGEIPSPFAPPSGCRFHTRCPLAQPVCTSVEPEWRMANADSGVACHFSEI